MTAVSAQNGQTPQIPVAPVDVTTTVGTAVLPDGRTMVTLACQIPLGILVYMFSADHAKSLSAQLGQHATFAGSGLVTP